MVPLLIPSLDDALESLEVEAQQVAERFMSSRRGRARPADRWSDLVLRVTIGNGHHLKVEWRLRSWLRPGNPLFARRRFITLYLPSWKLKRHAKAHEQAEVFSTLRRLDEIRALHQRLHGIRRSACRLGYDPGPALPVNENLNGQAL